MAICNLPFCKLIENYSFGKGPDTNFIKQKDLFLKSNCIFTVKAVISSNGIKSFLEYNSADLNNSSKESLSKILLLEGKYDNIYWNVFDSESLFHLLVDVCYLPSKNAHPDCWILTKLKNDNQRPNHTNCGFISFALKLYRSISLAKDFRQANSENTFQSSMEYIYSEVLPTITSHSVI